MTNPFKNTQLVNTAKKLRNIARLQVPVITPCSQAIRICEKRAHEKHIAGLVVTGDYRIDLLLNKNL